MNHQPLLERHNVADEPESTANFPGGSGPSTIFWPGHRPVLSYDAVWNGALTRAALEEWTA